MTNKNKKEKTLNEMFDYIKEGDNFRNLNGSSNYYLRAIAIGIKYLVENSK